MNSKIAGPTSDLTSEMNESDKIYKTDLQVALNNHHVNIIETSLIEKPNGEFDYSSLNQNGMLYLYIHEESKHRSVKTKREYFREISLFFQWVYETCHTTDIRTINRTDTRAFQLHLQNEYNKETTLSKKITIVKSFLIWCMQKEYLTKNLALGLINVKISKNKIVERDISKQDVQAALSFLEDSPKKKSLLQLLATTGMRLNEVIAPSWGDIYFDDYLQKYYLKTLTKNGKIRHVHIKDYVLNTLMEYRERVMLPNKLDASDTSPFYPNNRGKFYRLSSISTAFSQWMKEAGLTTRSGYEITPHFLRHFFAQQALRAGAPLKHISMTLQHSSSKITEDNYLKQILDKDQDVGDYVDV